ncbi:copper resistance-associated p-type ATPase [Diplocarpon rosae]|nr:copper resistance-associated p-type ATPase [Diplocarpon rosae]
MAPRLISEKSSHGKTHINMVTSSFILSNLHCPSCVSHIQDTLYALDPSPTSVSPSLVSSVVTVEHDSDLSCSAIQDALKDAGFDIFEVAPGTGHPRGPPQMGLDGAEGYLDRILDRLSSDQNSRRVKRPRPSSQHIQHCEACRRDAAQKTCDAKPRPLPERRSRMSSSAGNTLVTIDSVDSQASSDLWRASLAIGGMTCAACVGNITEQLEKKDWIKKVVINLISNSATIDFVGKKHAGDIVESIEDIGYDAAIDRVFHTNEIAPSTRNIERTVEILVDGMFCEHCPTQVLAALAAFGNKIKIDKPVSLQNPILKITYTPEVPDFTIRDIVAAISAGDEAIMPSVYHPPTLEERSRQLHAREQLRILIRVVVTSVIAIPTLIIGIVYMSLVPAHNHGRMFLMRPIAAGVSGAQWALFIMSTPVWFFCADVFHLRAFKEVRSMWRRGSPTPIMQRFYRFGSMNMLMSLGTSIAYLSSVAQLIAAGVGSAAEPDNAAFYFDSVVFLTLFLLVGRLIESYSKSKTGDAVTMLGKLRPTEALLVKLGAGAARRSSDETLIDAEHADEGRSETVQSVNVDLLEFGDTVRILHGGSPPCDGTVVNGESRFDESSLTGESRLVHKVVGNEVFSGTVNKESSISVKITGVAGSSMLDQIVKAVREGQTRRAPMERIADTLTSYFVPFVTVIAIVTWLLWLSLGLSGALPRGYLGSDSGANLEVEMAEEIAGRGMRGKFRMRGGSGEALMIVGNEALLEDNDVMLLGPTQSTLEKWKLEGKSVALAAIKMNHSSGHLTPGIWQLAAMFAVSDPIRPGAPGIVSALHRRGTDVWMLSGDNQMTANAIGSKIGIPLSNIIAGVLPSEKADKIRYLQKSLKAHGSSGKEHLTKRAMIAMVGDGINDSPALTTADVGIAIGSGSDIAISSAEFVLVSSNLNSLITLLDLSKFVFRRIQFNFAWALVYNVVALPVAAGALYPIISGGKHVRLDPVWASLAMALSSISVVLSSLALRSRLPGVGFKERKVICPGT